MTGRRLQGRSLRGRQLVTDVKDRQQHPTTTGSSIGSGPTGEGILLEDGTSFLLAENSNYLIQEA
mgnify:CR=1 FL=1